MTILFSPSEAKTPTSLYPVSLHTMWPPELANARKEVLSRYETLLQQGTMPELQTLFGLKDPQEVAALRHADLSRGINALERYTGVAYDHLDVASLPRASVSFLNDHVVIFSNLFGPVLGATLPYYKLSQGKSLAGFKPELYYKEVSTPLLDKYFENHFIVDLRAGFYEKFYTLRQPYVAMKFLKDGKNVSHWAKAYRGKVLRDLALHQPEDEAAFAAIPFAGLRIREIQHKGFAHWYVFDIVE